MNRSRRRDSGCHSRSDGALARGHMKGGWAVPRRCKKRIEDGCDVLPVDHGIIQLHLGTRATGSDMVATVDYHSSGGSMRTYEGGTPLVE